MKKDIKNKVKTCKIWVLATFAGSDYYWDYADTLKTTSTKLEDFLLEYWFYEFGRLGYYNEYPTKDLFDICLMPDIPSGLRPIQKNDFPICPTIFKICKKNGPIDFYLAVEIE